MGTTVSKRVLLMMEELEKDQVQFATIADTTKSVVNQWVSGSIKSIAPQYAYAIEARAGYSAKWVMLGEGPKRAGASALLSSAAPLDAPTAADIRGHTITKTKDRTEIHLEQFETGGAMGHGVLLRDQPGVIRSWNVSLEWLNKNVRSHSGAQNLSIVTGFGDSMKPMFNPGDPLIVDTGVKSVDFDAIYFFRVGNEGFIKRLQRIPGEGIRVISTNKEYESWTIRSDMDFEVFGRVLKVWCSEDF